MDIADGKDQAVTALLAKQSAPAGDHDGVTYYKATDGDTLTAVTDGALVITDSESALFAALDAHEAGGDKTLAGTDKFTDALGKLPDEVFAQGYLDVGSFVRQTIAQSPQLGQLGQLEGFQDAVVAASVAAEPDGVRVKGIVDGAERPSHGRRLLAHAHVQRAVGRPGLPRLQRRVRADRERHRDGPGEPGRGGAPAARGLLRASFRPSWASRWTTWRRSARASRPWWSPTAGPTRARPWR